MVVPVLAKGDPADQSSYGGETLLSVLRKIRMEVVVNRSKLVLEGVVREKWCGFRSG